MYPVKHSIINNNWKAEASTQSVDITQSTHSHKYFNKITWQYAVSKKETIAEVHLLALVQRQQYQSSEDDLPMNSITLTHNPKPHLHCFTSKLMFVLP